MADLNEQIQTNYIRVAETIRMYGTPNSQFPKDKDLDYGTLRSHLENVGGLQTVLKNMKQKKMVDYRDPFIKDSTVITLVEDYYQEAIPQGITYDQIATKVKGEISSHQKANYNQIAK